MSKIPTLSGRKVQSTFEKLGFRVRGHRGSHRIMRHPDGRRVVLAYHAGDDIYRGTLKKLLQEANVSEDAFMEAGFKRR